MNVKEKLKTSFLFNLGLILSLCILLYIAFFASLHCVTHHGEEIAMPDIRGKSIDSAISILRANGFEIQIDSTYEPTSAPLSVLKQVPDTGAFVKKGRTIFVTINKMNAPAIPMPNIKDLSYRSAEMILRNNKLLIGDTVYKPDIATGAILEASLNGKVLSAGDMVPQGSKINLVIGNGLGNTEWEVPSVTGMSVDEAIIMLNQFNLQPFFVVDQLSEITDTPSAIIIDQMPRAFNDAGEHNRIKMNDFINLQIKQNPAPEEIRSTGGNNGGPADVNR